jgi:hypothetical protein
MSNWTIYLWQSGNTYSLDGTIPRPNENLETQRTSTIQKVSMADGSDGFITPEIKYKKEPFQMFFAETTSAFRTQIENYIINGDKVKILTHTAEEFIGFFTSYKRVWFTGVAPDSYDISVAFQPSS